MKIIHYILLLATILFFNKIAMSVPNWSVNPLDYSYNMTITGVIKIDYTESIDANDKIAAFVGEECRGVVTSKYNSILDRYINFLMVYSNQEIETVTFKVYKAATDEIIDIPQTIDFEINGALGNLERPYLWANPTLSNEAQILSLNIEQQIGNTDKNDLNFKVKVDEALSFNAVIPEFTVSDGAVVRLNDQYGQKIESGTTVLDFSSGTLVFWVLSADESNEQIYNVTLAPYIKPEIQDYTTDLADNAAINTNIIQVAATKYEPEAILSYSVDEEVNQIFEIDQDGWLILKQNVNSSVKDKYDFTYEVNDGLVTATANITINVLRSERTPLKVAKLISPNNDGINDTWQIENAHLYYDAQFSIFNTKGVQVFTQTGYDTPWDGQYEGKDLPVGAYYFVIKTPQDEIVSGTITLIR